MNGWLVDTLPVKTRKDTYGRSTDISRAGVALVPASLIALSAQAQSAAPASAAPRELARHSLTGPLAGFDALLIELRPAPWARGGSTGTTDRCWVCARGQGALWREPRARADLRRGRDLLRGDRRPALHVRLGRGSAGATDRVHGGAERDQRRRDGTRSRKLGAGTVGGAP